jgi:predicted RNA-binding Zn-ribbon protein involved in translation (DUF1610 family)
MPSWALKCPNCKIEFDHSRVDNFSLLTHLVKTKADIPKEGMQLTCPNCGQAYIYHANDVYYR